MAIIKPSFLAAASHAGIAAHVLGLTSGILVLVWVLHFGRGARLHSEDPDIVFNVHPLVMCLGFIIIAGEAIMAYRIVPGERRVQKSIHLMLHLVALTLGIFGVYAAFKYHKQSELPDMYTLHSWLGMCTICLYGLQWLFGFIYFWFPRVSLTIRTIAIPFHASAGLAIFLMTICTAETGFVQKGTEPGTETRLINFTGIIILLFGVAVCVSTALPRMMTM